MLIVYCQTIFIQMEPNLGWIFQIGEIVGNQPRTQHQAGDSYLKKAENEGSWFGPGKYKNPFPIWKKRNLGVRNTGKFFIKNSQIQPRLEDTKRWLPVHKPITQQPPEGIIRVTWISHATVLIQDGPVNILTDPIFADRSPDNTFGYKRLVDLPIRKEDLPQIHILLISHDHFDHFDVKYVEWLYSKDKPQVYFGKGCQKLLGDRKSYPMDWMDTKTATIFNRQYKIDFLPSCHWSGRGVLDHFQNLWGSFMLTTPEGKKIYFAGDTGYDQNFFKQIGQRYNGVDLSIIPIGAYEPRQFLCFQHVNPEQAVRIHYDLQSKQSLAMHWGTFQLANQQFLQPRRDLRSVIEQIVKNNIKVNKNFCCIQPGQSIIVDMPMGIPSWIRANNKANLTWLGHSSVLINYDLINILVDPCFVDQIQGGTLRWIPTPTLMDMPGRIDYVVFTYPHGKFIKEYMDYTDKTKWSEFSSQNQVLKKKEIYNPVYLINQIAQKQLDRSKLEGIEIKTIILGQLIRYGDFQIMCIAQQNSFATLITFINSQQPIICFYNGPNIKNVAKMVREIFPQVTIAYVPIRPLTGYDKFKKQSINEILSRDIMEADTVIPINWSAFRCLDDKDIMEPMKDIMRFIEEANKTEKVIIGSVGETRPLQIKMMKGMKGEEVQKNVSKVNNPNLVESKGQKPQKQGQVKEQKEELAINLSNKGVQKEQKMEAEKPKEQPVEAKEQKPKEEEEFTNLDEIAQKQQNTQQKAEPLSEPPNLI